MSKKQQLEKNLRLSQKLADFMASNPSSMKEVPSGASFVIFSAKDKALNRLNSKLVKSLKNKGKKVIRVTQENSKDNPWSFSTL